MRVPNRQQGLPVIVMVHACCGDRADLGKLAEAVAAEGAIVMNADWAGIKNDARFPDAYADVACAVRFARARAADFGGDPADVTLLGWSDGAMASAVVAAAGEQFDRSRCEYPTASSVPDAFIGVAGFYGWTLPVAPCLCQRPGTGLPRGDVHREAPRAWHDATPYGWLRSEFRDASPLSSVSRIRWSKTPELRGGAPRRRPPGSARSRPVGRRPINDLASHAGRTNNHPRSSFGG